MEGPPDWDLLAVVRSCCSTTPTTTTTTSPPVDLPPPPQEPHVSPSTPTGALFRFPNPFEPPPPTTATPPPTTNTTLPSFFGGGHHELHNFCNQQQQHQQQQQQTLICNTNISDNKNQNFQQLSTSPVSSSSSFIGGGGGGGGGSYGEPPQLRRLIKPTQVVFGAPHHTSTATHIAPTTSHAHRTKKRKNLMKKVCHVPAEGLSSDMWAWRKYGQKPIKGSPYPRGYYRCSSSKGCLARKQVERNRSDPKMFIVTYTAEHNHPMPTHRNSLAGSTRQKPLTTQQNDEISTTPEQPTCSSPSGVSLSPLTEKSESKNEGEELINKEDNEEENNNEMGLSDLMLNDDFYVGFEQIDCDDDGGSDCFSDQFSPPMEFPWLVNSSSNSTATAAGGS